MQKKNVIFILVSVLIIIALSLVSLYQLRKSECLKVKEKFIKTTLPEVYGPETPIEKREADNKKISEIYNTCLNPLR